MPSPDEQWPSTLILLTRARAGDDQALNDLFGRYLPDLRKWARGRLPQWARDLADTQDLVQEAAIQTFRKIDGFEYRGEGALRAYLRQAVINRIRDELRRASRQPGTTELDEQLPSSERSPLETAITAQATERYEAALRQLSDEERELVVGRVELGLTYAELARVSGRPSSDAARMAVSRALLRLTEALDEL